MGSYERAYERCANRLSIAALAGELWLERWCWKWAGFFGVEGGEERENQVKATFRQKNAHARTRLHATPKWPTRTPAEQAARTPHTHPSTRQRQRSSPRHICALGCSKEDTVETGLQSIDWERFGPLRLKVHRGQIRNREGYCMAGRRRLVGSPSNRAFDDCLIEGPRRGPE